MMMTCTARLLLNYSEITLHFCVTIECLKHLNYIEITLTLLQDYF